MATDPTTISSAAREALVREEHGPIALTDWRDAIFLHFAVDPAILQPQVPFPLDTWEGDAYVSVVAFLQRNFRLAAGGRLGALATLPVATYRFCNLRTYVRAGDAPGVFFIVEWIANLPSVALARTIYGLPYRFVRSRYDHDRQSNLFTGTVLAGGLALAVQASIEYDRPAAPTPPGSLDAFCLERYTAFTTARRTPLSFRIWHPAWEQHRVGAEVLGDSLLRANGAWYPQARLAAANYSPGIDGVWIGRPHRLKARGAGMPGHWRK
jgi:uncharacterized protein YqjF (DUF2071 family)